MVSVVADWSRKILARHSIQISGIVQGVGFRPFIYRLAHAHGLTGWVRNTPGGVEIEVQGAVESVAVFSRSIPLEAPALAVIGSIDSHEIHTSDGDDFRILPTADGSADIRIAPDATLCNDCLQELFDPSDRRFRYPFITCTNCGPRYSIITGTPYDRPKTTMAGFPLCPECLKEYTDPSDRRFHAQPLACPACGPQLQLLSATTQASIGYADDAIISAVTELKSGHILAVKGLGGYHLVVDACNNDAVKRLRQRKKRDEKPFAVMAENLAAARVLACLNGIEERLLTAVESPIVIVRKSPDCPVSELVAPHNDWLGLMLPYTPIHHLLLRTGGITALVMTSANHSDDPIAYEDQDALLRLSDVADYFLMHDRPIHIRCDDSVIRVFQDKPLFYRRSRGYVPRAIRLPFPVRPLLAVGAEMKSTICLAKAEQAFLSQHIGDLQNDSTCDSFRHNIQHLTDILEIAPELIVCDQHPDYLSSIYATESGLPLISVQHHHAHLASCMAENSLQGDVIGIIFDGTGYGSDGTIWGGEFLVGGYGCFHRAGHFRPVRLPGGDIAVREPWRMALSYLYAAIGTAAFDQDHPVLRKLTETGRDIFSTMLEKGINSPQTSSCGRLFDAVAALLNIRQEVSYDGQAAIELEALAESSDSDENLPFDISRMSDGSWQLDFAPLFPAILGTMQAGVSTATLARRFHATVAQASIDACLRIASDCGLDRVVLSGGVFQNRLLTELLYTGLTNTGVQVFIHRLTPPNDGCIALGQTAVAGWQTRRND